MDKLCKLSDEQLVKNYANGDSDAFDTLLARYQQKYTHTFSSLYTTTRWQTICFRKHS